jgi:hypothetical protein
MKRVEEISGSKITMYTVDLTDKQALEDVFEKVIVVIGCNVILYFY